MKIRPDFNEKSKSPNQRMIYCKYSFLLSHLQSHLPNPVSYLTLELTAFYRLRTDGREVLPPVSQPGRPDSISSCNEIVVYTVTARKIPTKVPTTPTLFIP